jgi:hypothetical protein
MKAQDIVAKTARAATLLNGNIKTERDFTEGEKQGEGERDRERGEERGKGGGARGESTMYLYMPQALAVGHE